jgi:hypothetical protein
LELNGYQILIPQYPWAKANMAIEESAKFYGVYEF